MAVWRPRHFYWEIGQGYSDTNLTKNIHEVKAKIDASLQTQHRQHAWPSSVASEDLMWLEKRLIRRWRAELWCWGLTTQGHFISYSLCHKEGGCKRLEVELKPRTDENITEKEHATIKGSNCFTSTDDLLGIQKKKKITQNEGWHCAVRDIGERQGSGVPRDDMRASHIQLSVKTTMEYTSYRGWAWHPSERTVSVDH